ncbi:MAG: Eco57I restriction-modification methylase domain-containing protein, partial [Thermodesulfobacteriota bacterium]
MDLKDMDKQQARNLIKETFEQPFDKTRFTAFIKNLLNRIDEASFTYQGQFIPDAYKPYISVLERIGKYSDGEHKIDILAIRLKKETSLERARTMQRNFVAWYLNGSRGGLLKDAALVAFIAPDDVDWRFSLVKMDYKFEQTPSGKMKVKEEFTPARRWSFLVGVNERSHTAQSRLVNILADDEAAPTLAELEEAFDIETVTKEFFLKYRDLFIRTKEALDKVVKNDAGIKADFEAKGVNTVDFAKKLLGQIIFLYFLQKKGWFGVGRDAAWGTGAKQFLRELFEVKHGSFNNFFNDILEPLFYEALRIDRSHDDDYYSRFNCKIPFLNGGLFDPIGNYDWVHTDIHLPDGLFSNKNKTKEGDSGDGILDIFDRYNFTVKEDEPLEKEVAIDPELLGKAYEKFNAIRPDNFEEYKKALKSGKKGDESRFNKQFGVYYTPREIVHYMCRQSLINYLFTELNSGVGSFEKLGDPNLDMYGNEGKKGQLDITVRHKDKPWISKEDIEILIHLGEQVSENEATALLKEKLIEEGKQKTAKNKLVLPESIRKNAKLIDDKLADITVCDPAVGSGAFPVGMMSEIVKARNILSVFIKNKNNSPKLPPLSKGGEGGFERAERTPYDFKRRCIEQSLYGVDIDHGAVEIAKLRLWLSLVVDEEDIKNIKPLPNLDYKIVCGNSLLGVEKDLFNNQLFNDLETLKPLYFNETNPTKKQYFKNQIDDLISQITHGHTEFDFEVYFSEVYHHKGGFDVVIANPPYVRQEAIKEFKPQLKQTFGAFYCGTADLYTYFYKRGLEILKPAGHLCFIAPNKFMRAAYGKDTRELLTSEATPKVVIDFGDLPIFDATTYPSILLMKKNPPISPFTKGESLTTLPVTKGGQGGIFLAATFTESDQLTCLEETLAAVGFSMPIAALKAEGWALERPEVLALMEKLRKAGKPLGEYVQGRFYRGVLTGLNEAFVIDEATRNRLIAEDPKSADLIKHWLRGRDVRKWKAEWAGLYVIFTRRGTDIEQYPAIKRHLEQFRKDLEPKKSDKAKHGRKPGTYKWFEIQDNIAYYKEFEKPKIIWRHFTTVPEFMKEQPWIPRAGARGGKGYLCLRVWYSMLHDYKANEPCGLRY